MNDNTNWWKGGSGQTDEGLLNSDADPKKQCTCSNLLKNKTDSSTKGSSTEAGGFVRLEIADEDIRKQMNKGILG